MDFGLVLQTDPPASRVVGLMRRAERNGFTHGWTFDSAVLWQEPFVIYDPQAEQTVSAETHHMNVDYSAYEGKRITGRVETVLSRGEPVITEREYTGHAGHGVYTPRSTCQYLN